MRRAPAPTLHPRERLAFLEGIRGVLALYVAVGHVFTMVDPSVLVGGPSVAPPWLRAVAAPFLYGHVAVALFIVVSGFSLQLGLLQGGGNGEVRSYGAFFRRRAARILPAYYACLALSILVAFEVTTAYAKVAPFSLYLPVDEDAVLSHVLLIQNLWPETMYKLNGVLWTIAIEAQLYLAFPWLARLQARRGRGVLLLVGIAVPALVGGCLSLLPNGFALGGAAFVLPDSFTYLRLWFAPLFAVGMAAAHLVYRPPLRGVRIERWVGAVGWLALILGLVAVAVTPDHKSSDVPFGVALACLCALGTAGGGGAAIRLLGTRSLAYLGGFSYSLYLIHHPVEQVVYALRPSWVRGPETLFAWLLLAGVPLMLVVAWLFSLGFERPLLRRSRARVPRSRRIVPASLPLPGLPGGL